MGYSISEIAPGLWAHLLPLLSCLSRAPWRTTFFLPATRSGRMAVFCPPCAPRRAAVSCPPCAPGARGGFVLRPARSPHRPSRRPWGPAGSPRRSSRHPRRLVRGPLPSPVVAPSGARARPPPVARRGALGGPRGPHFRHPSRRPQGPAHGPLPSPVVAPSGARAPPPPPFVTRRGALEGPCTAPLLSPVEAPSGGPRASPLAAREPPLPPASRPCSLRAAPAACELPLPPPVIVQLRGGGYGGGGCVSRPLLLLLLRLPLLQLPPRGVD
ncbi:unnamed protein product, partial [Closterium sp. NIES-53]